MEETRVQLYVEEHGQGLPVVFIHGFPLDHTIWNPLVQLLRDHARLILPDLRGHGQSPLTPGPYSMRLFADDILALLDQLKIEKAVLVGHSMGGYISLNFAHAYPHRLAGLGLVATQSAADTPERRQGRMIMAEEIQRRGLAYATRDLPEKYTPNLEVREAVKALILGTDPKSVIASLKGMAERPDATEWLSTISVPALVIAGAADALIPAERSRTMNQLLGWPWLVEVPDAGHMVMMEDPKAVADALHKFFHTVQSNQK